MEPVPSSSQQLELIDSHAHLDMSEFDADRLDVLARAQAAGVRNILAIGGAPGALASSMPFAERYDWIYAAAGIHPHEAKLATQAHYEELSRSGQAPKIPGRRRDRPRLSLRPFAARRSAARLHRTARLGAPCRPPHHYSLPRGLARLPRYSGPSLALLRLGWNLSLLHRHARRSPPWNRNGLPRLLRRQLPPIPRPKTCATWPLRCPSSRF